MGTRVTQGNRVAGGGRPVLYPQLRALAVGELAVLPWLEPREGQSQRRLFKAVYNYRRTSGRQFACRPVVSGLEVRRTA